MIIDIDIDECEDQTDSYSGGYYATGIVTIDGFKSDFNLSGSDGLQVLDKFVCSKLTDENLIELENLITEKAKEEVE